MLTWFRYLCASIAGLAGAHVVAIAHEQAVGLTEITFKTDPDQSCDVSGCWIEVAHRLSIHDAESTLMGVLGARADLIGDPDAQAKFAAYVADRFTLVTANSGDAVPLTLLGGEVERGYYWVYQEGKTAPGASDLLMSQTVLMDAIPRQTNRVNVKLGDDVTTLIFTDTSTPQRVSLP